MRLYLSGKTNMDTIMVNVAIFTTKGGEEFIIDRDRTEWVTRGDGTYDMVWKGLYLWDGEVQHYDFHLPDDIRLDRLEVEDDAPEGAFITTERWAISK